MATDPENNVSRQIHSRGTDDAHLAGLSPVHLQVPPSVSGLLRWPVTHSCAPGCFVRDHSFTFHNPRDWLSPPLCRLNLLTQERKKIKNDVLVDNLKQWRLPVQSSLQARGQMPWPWGGERCPVGPSPEARAQHPPSPRQKLSFQRGSHFTKWMLFQRKGVTGSQGVNWFL